MASEATIRTSRKSWRRTLSGTIAGLLTATLLCLAMAGWLLFSSHGLPSVGSLRAYLPAAATVVPAMGCEDARVAGSASDFQKLFPVMRAIDEPHPPGGKAKSFYALQIARTMLCDTREKNISRALREIRLAWQIRLRFTEDEQRTIFLNRAYLGPDAPGAYTAAGTYFGKRPGELTIAEAAMLVSLIQNPMGYSPTRHPDRALTQRNRTLETMRKEGLLSQEEAKTDMASPLMTK